MAGRATVPGSRHGSRHQAAGYAVVTFDQAAHGKSDGIRTTLPDFACHLLAIGRHFGPTAAVVGHSLGGAATARWLESQPDAVECVEISAEGFFARPSPYLAWLGTERQLIVRAPLLSIGTPGPLPADRLAPLVRIAEAAHPRFIVHPLAVRAVGDIRLRGPAPISLTPAFLRPVAGNVRIVAREAPPGGMTRPWITSKSAFAPTGND